VAERSSEQAALYAAAGNRFAVLDAFEGEPARLEDLARTTCTTLGLDGLLVAVRPREGGDLRMRVVNRDGSFSGACGNGLRCLARWALETGRGSEGDAVRIETDAGLRLVECRRREGAIVAARAEMGVPRVLEREAELAGPWGTVRATLIDMGNPHCVLFCEDVALAPVRTLGPLLERHERFPERTNVSFVEVATAGRPERLPLGGWGLVDGGRPEVPAQLVVRTWERGVGETAACGTGAGASAVAALIAGRVRAPVRVQVPGGRLEVEWELGGALFLSGPVEALEPRG